MAGLGVDLDLGAGGGAHPERRDLVGEPGRRIGRHVIRLVGAGADDVAGLHAEFLLEQVGQRNVASLRLADLARHRFDLLARLLRRQPHRVTHVKERARAERAHVVWRDVGVARHDAHAFRRDIEHLAGDLRHRGVRALAHVDGSAIKRGAAVGGDGEVGHRGGRRDDSLDRHGDATAAAQRAVAARERLAPIEPLRHALEHGIELGIAHDLAGCLRAPFAQQVLAAELERIELERARDHVGVALVGPHQLRNAEAAQCA